MGNDRILRRIKRLIALAEDNSNVNESHSAFLQAQEMMVKYGVDPKEITDDKDILEVMENSATEFKRVYWYERELAGIVAKNFRCKHYYENRKRWDDKQVQRRIMFMGTEQDSELASEMYKLVVSAIEFYTQKYLKNTEEKTRSTKNDYMNGFIAGLEEKFEEQMKNQEWGLVLQVPKEVHEKYDRIVTGKPIRHTIPNTDSVKTYQKGKQDGYDIDYKKETIKE